MMITMIIISIIIIIIFIIIIIIIITKARCHSHASKQLLSRVLACSGQVRDSHHAERVAVALGREYKVKSLGQTHVEFSRAPVADVGQGGLYYLQGDYAPQKQIWRNDEEVVVFH